MKPLQMFLAAAIALFIAGCSSVSITTDYDHEANFAAYKTFTWMTVSKDVVTANAPTNMFQNSLIDKRFRSAVNARLQAKGMSQDSASPDIYLLYHTGTEDKVNITNYGYGYGPRWGYGSGGVDVQQYTQGTIILDFVDSKTKQLVWRGVATGALAQNPDPAKAEEKLNAVAYDLLEEYPPVPGK